MSRTYILESLRAHLKARELTYKDPAAGLGLSEVSIKRLFTGTDIGLDRLEQICQWLQIEMADLFKSSPPRRKLISQLTQAQEAEISSRKEMLMVAVCALNFWSVQDMWAHLTLSRGQIQQLLRRLEEIGFLDMQGTRQYRLLISHNFAWITGGPIMRMVQGVSHDYFDDSFDGDTQVLRILNVRVSTGAQVRLRNRLEQIAQEYVDQSRADSHLPLHERPPVSLCIAARAWIPRFLREVLREDNTADAAQAPPLHMPPARRTRRRPAGETATATPKKSAKVSPRGGEKISP